MAQANLSRHRLGSAPKTFHGQSVVISLLFWDSSHGLNNICPSLVHDNALSGFYSNTHHLSNTSTPTCVECAFGNQRTQQSSAAQLSRTCPSNACGLCDRRAAHLWKSRRRVEQCSTSQANSGLRDSNVIPDCCSRKSLRVLAKPCTD